MFNSNVIIDSIEFQDKTGSCPVLPSVPLPCVSDVDECYMDNDCVRDRKCCSNGCYSICVAPAEDSVVPAAAGRISGGGGRGTLYNGLYGEASPERGSFFRLEVYKRVGFLRVEV